jgi:1-pyrroline-5-carboxylate dehydrogenase
MGTKVTYVTLFADPSLDPSYEATLKEVEKKYLGRSYPIYIGGEEVWTGEEFEDRSPVDTSILVGRFQKAGREHVRRAIDVAAEAFKDWERRDWRERVKVMRRAAELIDERKYEIAAVITYEVGKNRLEALAEAWEAIDTLYYYTQIMEEMNGYERKLGPGGPGEDCRMVIKPYGAWVVISPFNFPFALANGMILGALLTGNTVVFKPTSEAPLAGLLLYQVLRDAGVPPGAINFLTGPGDVFEEEVCTNPRVAGIAFTGSRDVGMRLYRRFHGSQPYPKPILLEMGSKNPTIVTDKADIEKAVLGTLRAAFGYGGQKCSATSRLYVHEAIYDKLIGRLVEETSKIRIGDPREKGVFLGPVINRRAVENFRSYVSEALRAGGRLLYGGEVLEGGLYSKGFYVQPTIIENLPRGHKLWREELFLPIVLVDRFSRLEEAIKLANDTEYGLTAGIFTEDPREIEYFFNNIEFGVTYANRAAGSTTGAWPGIQTFVGWKASGATGKGFGGPHYLLSFVREQSRTNILS